MKTKTFLTLSLLVLSTTMFLFVGQGDASGIEKESEPFDRIEGSEGTPFIPNMGQWDDEILYVSTTDFGHAAITKEGILYDIVKDDGEKISGNVISITPYGGDISTLKPMEETPTTYNFFIGDDPSDWATSVRSYDKVLIEDVWEGIDIEYHMKGRSLKYDIVLEPYADLDEVVMKVEGADSVSNTPGELMIDTGDNLRIKDTGLLAYHDDGSMEEVGAEFVSDSDGSYSFDIEGWDRSRSLRIDPFVYSTYLGGMEDDESYGIASDDDGNIYLAGSTDSLIFPTTPGAYSRQFSGGYEDGFISKFSSDGSSLLYSTYFGGSENDLFRDVEIGPDGDIWAVGHTRSTDNPTTENAYNKTLNGKEMDFMVVKLDSTGTFLKYSSYVGGTGLEMISNNRIMSVDDQGRMVFVGETQSSDYPVTPDAFEPSFNGDSRMRTRNKGTLTMISPTTGELHYSTYIGGEIATYARSMVMDDSGNIYVSGNTRSSDFPITEGAYLEEMPGFDALFLMKINLSLTDPIVYSTYFGGPGFSTLTCIDVDEKGEVYLTGYTRDVDFPLSENAFQSIIHTQYDCFVSKINETGAALVFSTFYGADSWDAGIAVNANGDGGATVYGSTRSKYLHSMINYTQENTGDDILNNFIFVIDEDGSNSPYQTVIGGSDNDDPQEMILASNGDAIATGYTKSRDFPVKNGSYDTNNTGEGRECYLFRMNLTLPPSSVRNLEITQGDACINLTWEEPLINGGLPVEDYIVYRGEYPSLLGEYGRTGGDTSFSDQDILVGKKYYYMIGALNGAGESVLSNVVTTTAVSRAGAPVNIRTTAGDETVKVEWSQPYITGNLLIDSYKVYREDEYGSTTLLTQTEPDDRQYIDNDVTNGVTYHYWMTTVNEIGESDPSQKYDAVPLGLPDSPVDLNATVDNGNVHLSWNPPMEDGGTNITAYQVLKFLPGGSKLVLEAENRTTLTDTLVELGETYNYQVRCINQLGMSQLSGSISVFVSDIPSNPMELNVYGEDGMCIVRWSQPYSSGGIDLTGYRVYRSENNGSFEMVTETEFNVYQYRDTSVDNGNNYTYRVTALNDQGESPVSEVEWAIPAGVPLKPRNVGVTEVNGTLVVEWNPPADSNGANVKSYQILRARGEGNMAVIAELDAENDKYKDEDVEIAVEYTYALKARNRMGLSRISDSAVGLVYSIPGSPTNIDAVQNFEGIRLSWAVPEMTGGLEIDYYEIRVPDDNAGGWKELDTVESGRTEYTHTDIVAGTTYRYALVAHNSRGESPLSDEVTVTPTGSPDAPLSVVLKETEEGNLKISWGSPRNDGGEPILHYMVERSMDEGEYEMVAIVLNSSTDYVDKNIEKGHTYSYRVVAENVRGGSEPSEVAGITMDEEASGFSMDSIPGPVYIGIIIALLVLVVALSLFTLMRRKRDNEQVAEPTPVTSDVNQGYVNGYGGPDAGQDPYYQQGYTDQYAE